MTRTKDASRKQAFADHVVAQMAAFGVVQAKAMFGGHGIYHQGLMFALVANDQLYFKVDAVSEGEFERLGLLPFTYEFKGKVGSLRYRQAPPEVLDELDHMSTWARKAYDCALRAAALKVKKKPSSSPNKPHVPLAVLANLGSKSQAMLAKAGIRNEADLKRLGAVRAYARTKVVWPAATLNLLWALEGGLTGRHWQDVANTDRATLLMALEDELKQR